MASSPSSQRLDTMLVTAGRPDQPGDPLNTGLSPASSYRSDPTAPAESMSYARTSGNPGWEALEEAVGRIEGGTAVSFSSGMAAVGAVLGLLPTGAHVLAPTDLSHGVAVLLDEGVERLGWTVERIPNRATERWVSRLNNADLVWIESPSNPLLELADIASIGAAARRSGVPVAVDNTFATPLLQRPLSHGATYSVHSATKFIGGHSDLLSGIVIAATEEAAQPLRRRRSIGGTTPGTLESFLALRGLRTLSVRLERSQGSAESLAKRLGEHRLVTQVYYPGLKDHPGYRLAKRLMDGPGSMLSFEVVGSATSLDVRLSRLRIITTATSLGGVESTIERRSRIVGQDHLPETLVRMSVGLEDPEDLWEDLDQALHGVVS